jgi:hypothetical protein
MQLIQYGSVFFYYNRIMQFLYDHTVLDQQAMGRIDELTKKSLAHPECLSPDYRVDMGSIYFARAVVFQNEPNTRALAAEEVKNFLIFWTKMGEEGRIILYHISRQRRKSRNNHDCKAVRYPRLIARTRRRRHT